MSKPTIEQKWRQQIEEVKAEAGKLSHSRERDALLKKARQLETASRIAEWMSSPGLQPPKWIWRAAERNGPSDLGSHGQVFSGYYNFAGRDNSCAGHPIATTKWPARGDHTEASLVRRPDALSQHRADDFKARDIIGELLLPRNKPGLMKTANALRICRER